MDDTLKQLSYQAVELRKLEARMEKLADETKEVKRKADHIRQEIIPELMDEAGVTDFRLSDGTKVSVKEKIQVSTTGKYRELNNELMSFQGQLTESASYQIAASVGYDIATLKELAETSDISDKLNLNYQLAQALGLQGTPAFIIGDQVIRGYLPVEDMQAAVEQARSASN